MRVHIRGRLLKMSRAGVLTCVGLAVNLARADEPVVPDASRLEEVVVTAQKRSEKLMDVPSSITVLGGQELEKMQPQSLVDLNGLVPGLTVASGGAPGQTQLSLRGIADTTTTSLVGTYIDELPIGSSTSREQGATVSSADLMPYDIERVEVLSGPQGTLYGASTMGGLLKYVLKQPQLQDFDARVGVVANYIDHSDEPGGGVRAVVNVPLISSVLGIRLSGYDQKTQGYIKNEGLGIDGYNAYRQDGGRLAALWKVTESLSIKFSAMFQKITTPGSAGSTSSPGGVGVTVDPGTLRPQFGQFSDFSFVPTPFEQRAQLYSLVADWNLGFATLTSASGWQQSRSSLTLDLTAGRANWGGLVSGATAGADTDARVAYHQNLQLDKFTQEVRLAAPAAQRFEWMLGAFYTHEHSSNQQPVYALTPAGTLFPGINPFFDNNGFPSTYDEGALFTNDTWHFTEKLDLTAGLRYAVNRQWTYGTQYGGIYGPGPTTFDFLNPDHPAIANAVSSRQGVTTWMVSPEWHWNPDSMAYARVATGYRPGGPTNAPAGTTAPTSYVADTLTNYEIGLKGAALERHLSFTLALYDIEWKNIQVLLTAPNGLEYLGNGKTARSRGGELGLAYLPTQALRLGMTLGYVDARLSARAPGLGGVRGDGTTIDGLDGSQLPYSSRVNGGLTADFRQPFAGNKVFELGGAFRYASPLWTDVSSLPTAIKLRQPHPFDLYTGVQAGRVDARLYLRNIFNSEPSVAALRVPATYAGFNALMYTPIQPRTIGLNVDVSFD